MIEIVFGSADIPFSETLSLSSLLVNIPAHKYQKRSILLLMLDPCLQKLKPTYTVDVEWMWSKKFGVGNGMFS